MPQTVVCPHCTGKVGHMRGQSLDDALERHLRVGCPSPMVKPAKLAPVAQLAEAPDSSSGSAGSTPAGGTPKRVRMIPAGPTKSRKR